MRTINFYRTRSGRCPVEEFLDALTSKQAQKIAWVLQLIEQLEVVPTQNFKKLVNTEDIWEVRIQQGGNIFRLLGFFDGATLIILTQGFAQKSQKAPLNEIRLAESRKRDYFTQ